MRQCKSHITRHRPYAPSTAGQLDGCAEPVVQRTPRGHALRLQQTDQLLPDEHGRVDVVGTAAKRANGATKVPGKGAQAAARQVGQEAPRDIPRADDIERKHGAGESAEELLFELREVDDRRRWLLRETRGVRGQLVPGVACVDGGPHHGLRDPGDPRNGGRDVLAVRKCDQAGV